ncbi:hypothetical protein LTR15_011905 [Elasticomyces elasticus]|nr:hypothetical protein LTR15_011905 [Elasticomyces elasticus]
MEEACFDFAKEARSKGCKAAAAAHLIRSSSLTKVEGSGHDDTNILPTPQRVRAALGIDKRDGSVSSRYVVEILRCQCPTLCGPHSRAFAADAVAVAKWIIRNSDRITSLAALILAGCTFAIRVWYDRQPLDLDAFLNLLQDPGHPEAREDLFSSLLTEFIPRDGSQDRNQRLTASLRKAIRAKSWLFRICRLGRASRKLNFTYSEKYNFPFVEETPAREAHGRVSLTRCKIADEYCSSPDLKGQQLFRKAVTFARNNDHAKSEARREANVLMMIKELQHPNIVDALFAFEETIDPEYAISNIVFPYCEFDLREVLNVKSLTEVHKHFAPVGHNASILTHGLWEAVVSIVDAVHSVHHFISERFPLEPGERIAAGHFDIKPANIIVDTKGTAARLLLTDFGNAILRRVPANESSGQEGIHATYDYAPPEFAADRGTKIRKSYDVWSLGCVLLEVLVFVMYSVSEEPEDTVDNFYLQRQDEAIKSRPGSRGAPFWTDDVEQPGEHKLQATVVRWMNKIRKSQPDDRELAGVVEQVEVMLRTQLAGLEPRPEELFGSLQRFRGVDGIDGRVFLQDDHVPLMPRLHEM